MGQPQNPNKIRKSDAQEAFEQADNAGRFSANDADSRAAREKAMQNIKQDTNSTRQGREPDIDNTDAEARRDRAQSHDYKGESQNVNDDTSRPLNEDELQHARNKAREGKQGDERFS
jgi:hypothetical protein